MKAQLCVNLNIIRLSNVICQILYFCWSDACVLNVICHGCRRKQSQTQTPVSLQCAAWLNDFVEINKQTQMLIKICPVQTVQYLVWSALSANLYMHKGKNTNVQVGTFFSNTQTLTLIRKFQWNINFFRPVCYKVLKYSPEDYVYHDKIV